MLYGINYCKFQSCPHSQATFEIQLVLSCCYLLSVEMGFKPLLFETLNLLFCNGLKPAAFFDKRTFYFQKRTKVRKEKARIFMFRTLVVLNPIANDSNLHYFPAQL